MNLLSEGIVSDRMNGVMMNGRCSTKKLNFFVFTLQEYTYWSKSRCPGT